MGTGRLHFTSGTQILPRRSISLFLIPDGLSDIKSVQVSATNASNVDPSFPHIAHLLLVPRRRLWPSCLLRLWDI
jgi:hypothetical protein